jgi:methyltransferase-like protein/2-polyprenyl-3-methyl-5-hydroxy-6-metoxy-1,4-benzoquinol methylase
MFFSENTNTYDELPYPSKPFPQTHPRHLATISKLHGIESPKITNCKVLEIGCANGSNIIPMACDLPDSHFIGIDFSKRQIKQANNTKNALKINNINFYACNILDIDDSYEQFDYIIAHGIYSWIPDNVKEHLINLCKQRLTNKGIVYISYNTYPGWKMREILRDEMLFHAKNFSNISEKIEQSKLFINLLSEVIDTEYTTYGDILKNEINSLWSHDESYFYHDLLEGVNNPIYFYQFIENTKKAGLQYIGDTDYSSAVINNINPKLNNILDNINADYIQKEQYLDFVWNRMFRQSLLCHNDISLDRSIVIDNMKQMYFSSNAKCQEDISEIKSNHIVSYMVNDLTIKSDCKFTKSILHTLGNAWPESISYETLLQETKNILELNSEFDDDKENITSYLNIINNLYTSRAINIYIDPPHIKKQVTNKPLVRPITRLQAKYSQWTTNQLHQPISVDTMSKFLIPMLDGNHTFTAIKNKIFKFVKDGSIKLDVEFNNSVDDKIIMQQVESELNSYLERASKFALLIN